MFTGNSALVGGAICAESTSGTAFITNNTSVLFENNAGGAIFANSDVQIQGNEQVCFSGNGTAIDAESVILSTTANKASAVQLYDSLISRNHLYLNTLTPQYNVEGGTANGCVLFTGETSHSTVAESVTLGSGVARIEKGATLKAGTSVDIKGGNLCVVQHEHPLTSLTMGSNLSFGSTTGTLTFDLNYNQSSDIPLVSVGGKATLGPGSFVVDDSGLVVGSNPADIALLSIAGNLVYEGTTYSYAEAENEWAYTSGSTRFILKPEALLNKTNALHDGSSVYWKDRTLYYGTAETEKWKYAVKGYESAKTWRDDVLYFYDVNKKKVYQGGGKYDDSLLCWLASACNMVYYWQDTYAPLYQGTIFQRISMG